MLDDLSDILNGRPPRNGQYQPAPQLIPIPIPVEDEFGRPVQPPQRYPPGYGGNYGGGYYGITMEQPDSLVSEKRKVPLFNI